MPFRLMVDNLKTRRLSRERAKGKVPGYHENGKWDQDPSTQFEEKGSMRVHRGEALGGWYGR